MGKILAPLLTMGVAMSLLAVAPAEAAENFYRLSGRGFFALLVSAAFLGAVLLRMAIARFTGKKTADKIVAGLILFGGIVLIAYVTHTE